MADPSTRSHRRPARRLLTVLLSTVVAAAAVCGLAGTAAATPPDTPDFSGIPIDAYAQQPASGCLPADPHRPGVEMTMDLLLDAYPNSVNDGTFAPCSGHTGNSDHYTGRALDWAPRAPVEGQEPSAAARADGDELTKWLLETVDGEKFMRVRRLGIVYIIWYDRIWTTTAPQWEPYTVPETGTSCAPGDGQVTLCHRDHVHLSFGYDGAEAKTSWWQGRSGVSAPGTTVAVTSGAGGRQDAFGVEAKTGRLLHKWYSDDRWSSWESLAGGHALSAVAATTDGGSRFDVFGVERSSGRLLHKWYSGGEWSSWESLEGGHALGSVAATAGDHGRFDVFGVEKSSGRLLHRWYADDEWKAWQALDGGHALGSVAATAGEDGRYDVYGSEASSGRLLHRWYVDGDWKAWESLADGHALASVAAVNPASGRDDAYGVEKSTGRLLHKWYLKDSWSNWQSLDGGHPLA